MRNLKRALSLGLTAAMISGLMVMGSSAASYADVTSEQNQEAIEVLRTVGVMVGDDNGNFNPDQKVTRNEMAVIMSNLMDYRVATYSGTSPFTDVPSWAEPYVAACYTNGIIAGYDAKTFGGNDSVTTGQAALMLMKALGYFQYASDFGSDWQLETVSQATKIDLFTDVDSGVRDVMTRNDVAQLVLNALEAGTVEAMGWNQYGGWRVGIRSLDSRRYYYYAHLKKDTPFAPGLQEGDLVQAGQVIGFMGRTGYSTQENVNNIETVHLHFGLELIFDESQKECNSEIWIDVYHIVRLLNRHRSSVLQAEDGTWQRVYAYRDLDTEDWPDTPG